MIVKYNCTTDEMATSYRTSTMAEIRTMSRRTFIVRHAFLCRTTLRTTKMHCRTMPSYDSLWRFHRTFTLIIRSYDSLWAILACVQYDRMCEFVPTFKFTFYG